MDSFKDVLEAAQAYCKTQMAEPTYNLYIDGLEPISFEDSSHITLSVRNDFICKIVTDRYLGLLKEAFKTVLGPLGGLLVSLGIVLFAFSTILGWEFCGETAFAFLFGRRAIPLYRILFALAAFLGATQSLEVVWNLSDIFNGLMAVPNLISLLLLSGTAARELEAFQPEIRRGRRLRQRRAVRRAL